MSVLNEDIIKQTLLVKDMYTIDCDTDTHTSKYRNYIIGAIGNTKIENLIESLKLVGEIIITSDDKFRGGDIQIFEVATPWDDTKQYDCCVKGTVIFKVFLENLTKY